MVYNWARFYVNNIIYRAKSFNNLLSKLCIFFEIFIAYNIPIKLTKIFFNYPNIGLFSRKFNILGLTTAKKKLDAITLLQYLIILGALKYYLKRIGYPRFYIYYYM